MMQKQLIKYGFMAFSSVFLFINPIRAADDPCADGATCEWTLDDDGNLTIKSGTYKANAFKNQTFKTVNIIGDELSFGNGALSGIKAQSVNVNVNKITAGINSGVLSGVNTDEINIIKGDLGSGGVFRNSNAKNFNIVGNNISGDLECHRSTFNNVNISGNNSNFSGFFAWNSNVDNLNITGSNNTFGGYFVSLGASVDKMTIGGENNSFNCICCYGGCSVSDVEVSGNGTNLGGYTFRGASVDSILLSGDNTTNAWFSFLDTTIGTLEISGDNVSLNAACFKGIQAENIIFSGENTSIGSYAFEDGSSPATGNIIFADGKAPESLSFFGTDNLTFICSETDKNKCSNISNYKTGIKPKVEIYTYDEKTGFYNYKHKRYKDPSKIATGDYIPRRIYTLEEALEVAGDKGNKFMLRYK